MPSERWAGGKTGRFSPRKPHKKRGRNRSLTVSPPKDPGPGAYVPNHLAIHYRRDTHASSASPLVLMVALHQQSKGRDS
jgi:hypothetical protein